VWVKLPGVHFSPEKDYKSEQGWEQNSNRRLIYLEESIEVGTAIVFFEITKRPKFLVLTLVQQKKQFGIHISSIEPDGFFCWCLRC